MLPIIRNSTCINNFILKYNNPLISKILTREYAARKGTREKARKKKVKVEEKKVGFIPHNQRELEKLLLSRPKKKFDDSWKQIATDNVYPAKYYQWRVYAFEDAVQCHRETHHPTMYNEPNAMLTVRVELDMRGEKTGRYVEALRGVAPMAHAFPLDEERQVLAVCRDESLQTRLKEAGAALVGGPELIRAAQAGDISLGDFHYVLAHPDILPEMVALRGLLRRRFPNPKNGTLAADLEQAVRRFLHGVAYFTQRDEHEPDFAAIEAPIGTLEMPTSCLETNFKGLLCDVERQRPRRSGPFITRSLLLSAPSTERLKVNHMPHINDITEFTVS